MKIALPLIAVGLLATVFLVPKEDGFEGGLVFSRIDLETLGDGLTIRNPRFSGVTSGGDTFSLTADTAIPDAAVPTRMEMDQIQAEMRASTGQVVTVRAKSGKALVKEQLLQLTDGVTIDSSDGYQLVTDGGEIDMATATFVSSGPVTFSGPGTRVTAGQMRLQDSNGTENRMLWFEKGVKVTYLPNQNAN